MLAPAEPRRAAPDVSAAKATPAVSFEDVSASYGGAPATLRGVTFDVPRGGSLAVVGPSGAGKTTLLKVLTGLLKPRTGRVSVLGHEPSRGRRACDVGYIPQNLGLVRNLSVLDNVLLGCLGRCGPFTTLFDWFPPQEVQAAQDALGMFGLQHKGSARIGELSGGERRRVAIARAFLQRPKLLVADEFFSELDYVTAEGVVASVKSLRNSHGTSLVFVEHNLTIARRVADEVVVLSGGRVAERIPAKEATDDRLRHLFGGRL